MHRLTRLTLSHRFLAATVLLGLSVAFAAGLPRVRTEFGYRVLVGDNHAAIQRLDRFIEEFGGGLPVRIVYECGAGLPCRHALDPVALRMAVDLTNILRPLDRVRDVTSPANAPLLIGTQDGFEIRRLVENGAIAPDRDFLASRAINDRLWRGTLVSEDGGVGSIVVQSSDTRPETDELIVDAILDAIRPYQEQGFRFYPVGDAISTVVSGRELSESSGRMVPLTVLVIAAVLFVLTRSWSGSLAALITMGVALVWTFGALGWLGWPQDGILEILAPLILTVGVCDAVHCLSQVLNTGMRSEGEHDPTRTEVICSVASDIGPACLVTTLTTAGAFLTFVTSDLATFVRFGSIAAVGVVACLILTFSLLPLLLSVWAQAGVERRARAQAWDEALMAVVRIARTRSFAVLVIAAIVGGLSALGWVTRLRVDNDWLESFGEQSKSVQWIRFTEERLGPVDSLELTIDIPSQLELSDPQVLAKIKGVAEELERQDDLGRARSIVDVLANVSTALNGGLHASPELLRDERATAELLELVAFGGQSLLDAWVSTDRSQVRVSAEAPVVSYTRRKEMLKRAEGAVAHHIPTSWRTAMTGGAALNHDWVRDIQATQLRSFPTAFLLIFVLVAIFLRSFWLGVAAMLPTALPVVVTLGAMGWMGMSLDVGRAMIAAVVLGIAVDDSIHLLAQYRRERVRGTDPGEAIQRAVLHVGRAVVTTSLALALGFLTLMASAWQTVSSFGFYVALAILGALAADLLVLPALIYAFAGSKGDDMPAQARARLPLRAVTRRRLLLIFLTMPVVGTLGLAGAGAVRSGVHPELSCWVLPNARIAMLASLQADCPLPPHTPIRAVRFAEGRVVPIASRDELTAALPPGARGVSVLVSHDARERWEAIRVRQVGRGERLERVAIAAAAAVALLALPGLLLWFSNAAALMPFALLYAVFAVVAVLAIAARESVWASRVGLTASVFGPAILSHLALVFPRERQVARDVPAVTWIPYGLAAMLLPAAWLAHEHQPLLWPPVSLGLVVFSVGAWAILLLSSVFAVRESASPLERARARTLLSGAIGLPLFTLALLSFVSDIATALAVGLMASVALMPLPIGLAVSRYNLFDLGNDVRGAVAHVVFYSVAACLLAIAFLAGSSILREVSTSRRVAAFLVMAVIVLSAIEPMRHRIFGWMEGRLLPRLEKMRAAGRQLGREIGALQGPQEVTKHLGEAIVNGLSAEQGSVLRARPYGWTEDFAWGPPLPCKEDLADHAEALLADRTIAQLSEVDDGEPDPRAEALYDSGIRAVAKLGSPQHALAIVLVGAPQHASAFSTLDLEFVDAAAGQAALALRNAEVAAALLEAEQRAASGRVAVALVHEVGKEIGLLGSLARRLGERLGDPERASRDVRAMNAIAADVDQRLRSFVREAASGSGSARRGAQTLGAVVGRAVRATERIHGEGRTIEMLPSALRAGEMAQQMERVISILLDNAFRASPAEAKVRVSGVMNRDELRLTVSDGGTGMNRTERDRAFDPGYTTRRGGDGAGIGLPIARELVRELGGDLTLHQNASGGTDAVVRVPQRKEARA